MSLNLHIGPLTPFDEAGNKLLDMETDLDDTTLTNTLFAIRNKNPSELVDIINRLATDNKAKGEKVIEQEKKIQMLQAEINRLKNSGYVKSPAQRDDLDMKSMEQLYQEYKSFRKVGELMGCDGKTVQNRLRRAGKI